MVWKVYISWNIPQIAAPMILWDVVEEAHVPEAVVLGHDHWQVQRKVEGKTRHALDAAESNWAQLTHNGWWSLGWANDGRNNED